MQLGATMLEARRPLIVRLRNWVGDVVLSTPVLLRLQALRRLPLAQVRLSQRVSRELCQQRARH